jgi:hypothetical protein
LTSDTQGFGRRRCKNLFKIRSSAAFRLPPSVVYRLLTLSMEINSTITMIKIKRIASIVSFGVKKKLSDKATAHWNPTLSGHVQSRLPPLTSHRWHGRESCPAGREADSSGWLCSGECDEAGARPSSGMVAKARHSIRRPAWRKACAHPETSCSRSPWKNRGLALPMVCCSCRIPITWSVMRFWKSLRPFSTPSRARLSVPHQLGQRCRSHGFLHQRSECA